MAGISSFVLALKAGTSGFACGHSEISKVLAEELRDLMGPGELYIGTENHFENTVCKVNQDVSEDVCLVFCLWKRLASVSSLNCIVYIRRTVFIVLPDVSDFN